MAVRKRRTAKQRRPKFGGIDCGKKGWMVLYDGRKIVCADPLPWLDRDPDLTDLIRYFKRWKRLGVEFVLIEDQQAFPRDTAVSAFSLGGGFWSIQAVLAALGIPFGTLTSAEWRREIGIKLPSGGTPKAKKKKLKARSIAKAQKLAPGFDFRTSDAWNSVPNDNKAEAFLMSVVAYRRHGRVA